MDQIHDCGGVAEMYLVGEERGRANIQTIRTGLEDRPNDSQAVKMKCVVRWVFQMQLCANKKGVEVELSMF